MTAQTYTIEAEQSLLGALMTDARCADRIDANLTASSFYREDHARIFAAIQSLRADGKPHDSLSVVDALERTGEIGKCGGMAYLVELEASVVSTAGASRHAEMIAERALRRSALAASAEISQAASNPEKSAREVVDFAQSRVMALGEQSATRAAPVHAREAIKRHVQRLQARMDGTEAPGIGSGLPDVDKRLNGGFRPGHLIILAARPGMGKTALALQIAVHCAINGITALVCSQEMPESELIDRAISLHGRIPLELMMSGQFDDDMWSRVTFASMALNDASLWLDEQSSLTLMDVRNKARRVKREQGSLGLIVVDYLQLMVGEGDNRNAEIEKISRGLKHLAKEMGVPVIALSQLSRKCEERPNKRPMASDLRDSGAIEQDADLIMTLYRDEVYHAESPYHGLAELGIVKARSGKAGGFVPLAFRGEYTRFDSMFGDWPQTESRQTNKRRGFDA